MWLRGVLVAEFVGGCLSRGGCMEQGQYFSEIQCKWSIALRFPCSVAWNRRPSGILFDCLHVGVVENAYQVGGRYVFASWRS